MLFLKEKMITKDTTLKELAHMLLTNDSAQKAYVEFLKSIERDAYQQGFTDAQELFE